MSKKFGSGSPVASKGRRASSSDVSSCSVRPRLAAEEPSTPSVEWYRPLSPRHCTRLQIDQLSPHQLYVTPSGMPQLWPLARHHGLRVPRSCEGTGSPQVRRHAAVCGRCALALGLTMRCFRYYRPWLDAQNLVGADGSGAKGLTYEGYRPQATGLRLAAIGA